MHAADRIPPVTDAGRPAGEAIPWAELELHHRAVIASEVSFTISDPYAAGAPLVWVNPAFEATTGYRRDDVLGTNCRFLQGPHTDPEAVERIRRGLVDGVTVVETLLNYRADGTTFWNQLVISPIHDVDGRLTHHIGVQTDITRTVEAAAERDEALAATRTANARLAALAAVGSELTSNLETGEATIDALPAVIARHFPGWVAAVGLDPDANPTRVAVAHSDAERDRRSGAVRDAVEAWMRGIGSEMVAAALRQLRTASPASTSIDADAMAGIAAAAGLHGVDLVGAHGASFMVAPLTAKDATIGLLALIRDGEDAYDADDLAAVADLGVRAGVAVDNARLYAREHDAALTLQRSLLPALPSLPGFEVAATYQPAHAQSEVGGDWFDVLTLPGTQGVGVAVGDVMGHDLRAAAAMGQLRSVLRSYAWQGDRPADVIHRLDELVRGLGMASLATCAYAIVRTAEVDCHVTYTLAGHPPPMIRHPDGTVERLDQALTSPVGVAGDNRVIPQAATELPAGGYLVLYTDGLVERRHLDIDTSIDMVERALLAAAPDCSAQSLCDHLVDTLVDVDHDDDVCVLVLRRLVPAA